ncbi:hypothetical protein As57867_020494, partial [Aphanomyces stellatus]
AVADAAREPIEAHLDTTDPPTSVAEPVEEQAPVVAPVEAVEDTPPAPVEAAVEPPVEEPPATEAPVVVPTEPVDAAVADAAREPVEAHLDTTDPPTSVAKPVEEQAPIVAPVEAVEDTPPAPVEAAVEPPVEEPPATAAAAVVPTIEAAVAEAAPEPVEASVKTTEEPIPVAVAMDVLVPVDAPVAPHVSNEVAEVSISEYPANVAASSVGGFKLNLQTTNAFPSTQTTSPVPDFLFPNKVDPPSPRRISRPPSPLEDRQSRSAYRTRGLSLSSSEDSMKEVGDAVLPPTATLSSDQQPPSATSSQASIGLKSRLMGWWKDN